MRLITSFATLTLCATACGTAPRRESTRPSSPAADQAHLQASLSSQEPKVHYGPKDFLTNYGKDTGSAWTSEMTASAATNCLLTTKPQSMAGGSLSFSVTYQLEAWIYVPDGKTLADEPVFSVTYDYVQADGTPFHHATALSADASSKWKSFVAFTDEEHHITGYHVNTDDTNQFIPDKVSIVDAIRDVKISVCAIAARTRVDILSIELKAN